MTGALEKPTRDETGRFPRSDLTVTRDVGIEALGEDVLFEMVAGGASMREIADALGLDGRDAVARSSVRSWFRLGRNVERYDAARVESAEAHAELAGEVYGEKAPATAADAKWRNDRSGWHRWMAEMRDPSLRKSDVAVNVDIGSLHLEALLAAGSMDHNPDRMRSERGEPNAGELLRKAVDAEYEIEDEETEAGDG